MIGKNETYLATVRRFTKRLDSAPCEVNVKVRPPALTGVYEDPGAGEV
jgi:hypothetical protein